MRSVRLNLHPSWLAAAETLAPKHPRLQLALDAWRNADEAEDPTLDLQINLFKTDTSDSHNLLAILDSSERETLTARLLATMVAVCNHDLNLALERFPAIATEARNVNDDRILCWTLSEWGATSAMHGSRVHSYELLQECYALAGALKTPQIQGIAASNLGFLYGQDGKSAHYAQHAREALSIFRGIGDSMSTAHCLCNLAGALSSLGALDEALNCYTECLELAQHNGWRYIEALSLGGRGGMRCNQGDFERGIPDYHASEVILSELNKSFQIARHKLLLSDSMLQHDRIEESIALAKILFEESELHDFTFLKARALDLISRGYEKLGQYREALAHLRIFVHLQEHNIETRAADAHRTAERLQVELLARKKAHWERQQRTALEGKNRELVAALDAQKLLRGKLEHVSMTDALTGLANRRAFDLSLEQMVSEHPITLLWVDIDHFKTINDTHGHAVGDEVLIELSLRLKSRTRSTDMIARWGGDEFCILLPNTTTLDGKSLAEELRTRIEHTPFATSSGDISVSISLGVASSESLQSLPSNILQRADKALYSAKQCGRNRVALG